MRRLAGRVAVVTGAASGIGLAVAQALAAEGCELALVDLQADALAEAAARVGARAGARVTTHVADVASRERMEALASEVVAAHGRVELLVNNAGVVAVGSLAEQPLADVEWLLGVDLWGPLLGCKFFLPHLARADEAHVVNVSSMLGLSAVPGQSSYAIAKHGVRALSDALAAELAPRGIGVTCVFPGAVRTGILHARRGGREGPAARVIALAERFAIEPERVAERLVRAVKRNELRVVVGPDAVLLDVVSRAAPTLVPRLSGALLRWAGVRL